LTLQTATRRLLTTHPYSSDFPFVFSVVCVSPRSPDRGKSNICHQVKTKQKKTFRHQARRSYEGIKKSASTIDAQLPFEKV